MNGNLSNVSPQMRFLLLTIMILAAIASRLLPHPPNFAPIGAVAIFAGACFADRRIGFLLTWTMLLLSDLYIGFHNSMLAVYVSFVLYVLLGRWLQTRRSVLPIAVITLLGSVQFFLITNFASWLDPLFTYSKDLTGLLECYEMAIPFFWNSLGGDLFYVTILFGGLALLEQAFPTVRSQRLAEIRNDHRFER